MSARVLIVDSVAARRSAVADALLAARYEVAECRDADEAGEALGDGGTDLVLLDLGDGEGGEATARAAGAVRRLRSLPSSARGGPAPILALARPERLDLRLAALREGAEAAMERSAAPRLLQARIRALIRDRDADRDLRFRDEAEGLGLTAPGLAEAAVAFQGPAATAARPDALRPGALGPGGARADGRRPDLSPEPYADPRVAEPLRAALLVATPRATGGDGCARTAAMLDRLAGHLGRPLRLCRPEPEAGRPSCEDGEGPDLVLIDASTLDGDPGAACEAVARLVDLRSRPATRGAAVVLLLPPAAVDTAALALDLGAGEVLASPPEPEEAAARLANLLRRRAEAARLRDRIRSHLRAAVRDPLTGLHNRRYAEPALQRMAERARRAGRPLAVLLLDKVGS